LAARRALQTHQDAHQDVYLPGRYSCWRQMMDAIRKRDYRQGQVETNKDEKEGRCPMGDKGGKKDKAKDQKQKTIKQQQEAKRKLDKQPKKKP
jgi:hypothetical protein